MIRSKDAVVDPRPADIDASPGGRSREVVCAGDTRAVRDPWGVGRAREKARSAARKQNRHSRDQYRSRQLHR